MSRLVPRSTALTFVWLTFLMGVPMLCAHLWIFLAAFWMNTAFWWLWYRALVKRDRKLAAAARTQGGQGGAHGDR